MVHTALVGVQSYCELVLTCCGRSHELIGVARLLILAATEAFGAPHGVLHFEAALLAVPITSATTVAAGLHAISMTSTRWQN